MFPMLILDSGLAHAFPFPEKRGKRQADRGAKKPSRPMPPCTSDWWPFSETSWRGPIDRRRDPKRDPKEAMPRLDRTAIR